MNRRKRYLTDAEIAELMAAEFEDDLNTEDCDFDIDDPNYIPPEPAHAISSSDTEDDEFTNTAPASNAQNDSDSNDEGLANQEL